MPKTILFQNADGWLTKTTPAYEDKARPADETEDECVARVAAKVVPAGVASHIVELDSLPSEFFEAWEWLEDSVQVNMPNARLIHMGEIRKARDKELLKLDVSFMRAVESGDTSAQATIATEKQVLRDLPTTFDLSGKATTSTLYAAWPSELPARA